MKKNAIKKNRKLQEKYGISSSHFLLFSGIWSCQETSGHVYNSKCVVYALYVITISSGSGFSCILLQIGPGSKQFKKTLGLQGIRRCFVKPTLNSK